MSIQLETERLILRPTAVADFDGWAELMADSSSRFVGGPVSREASWRGFMAMAGAWAIQGYGMFSMIEKASGKWIGRTGPWYPEGWPGTEVGWGVLPSAAGKGFAHEAAVASMDWAFDTLGWTDIIHSIDPDNAPSIALAERLGSTYRGPGKLPAPYEHFTVGLWGQTREHGGRAAAEPFASETIAKKALAPLFSSIKLSDSKTTPNTGGYPMKRLFAAAVLAASLSACASTYRATPYVAGPQPITRVAILDDSLPEGISAIEVASIASNFGLIGALINAGVEDSREDAIEAALATVSFDAEADIERMLVEAFSANGVQAHVATNGRRAERKFLVNYPTADGQVQAYLDVVAAHYGYTSAGHGQPWRPTADVMVRLVSVPGNRTLMENRIAYNVMNAPRGVITIAPDPEFIFNNREEMRADPQKLANGLRSAFREVASTAANLMR